MKDPNLVFTLRLKPWRNEPMIVVNAYDKFSGERAWALDLEVRQAGKVIFERGGVLCCASAYCTSQAQDSDAAKELALACVAMKPGDTDADYFASYTDEQLAWVEHNGEIISCEREQRYCDENGNVKRNK